MGRLSRFPTANGGSQRDPLAAEGVTLQGRELRRPWGVVEWWRCPTREPRRVGPGLAGLLCVGLLWAGLPCVGLLLLGSCHRLAAQEVTGSGERMRPVAHRPSRYPLPSAERELYRLPPATVSTIAGESFEFPVRLPQPQPFRQSPNSTMPAEPTSPGMAFSSTPRLAAQPLAPPPPPLDTAEATTEGSEEAERDRSAGSAGPVEAGGTIGPPPESYELQFLRQGTVLLEPGQWQFDWGVSYALDDSLLPVVTNEETLAAARLRQRSLLVPFALRLGVTPSVQAFVNAPVGWGHSEFAFSDFDASENVGGIGDVSGGVNILVEPAHGESPDIVLTVGFVAPTGNDAFGPSLNSAGLGSGFWSAFGDLRFIHSYDPVVVFWGAGYRFQFDRSFAGLHVDPGDEITYQLGVGLAVNERVTVSAAFSGSVITETQVDGLGIPKSTLEPMRLRLALTTVTPRKKIVEPFVTFGLTDDAVDAEVGLIVTLLHQ